MALSASEFQVSTPLRFSNAYGMQSRPTWQQFADDRLD